LCFFKTSVQTVNADPLLTYNNWTYFIPVNESLTWTEAAELCESFSSYLVRIESLELQTSIEKQLYNLTERHNYWTAGYWSGNRKYSWENGTHAFY
jgi:hypothetical protein